MQYANWPKINPFKMVPCNAGLSSMHMDFDWTMKQVRSFELPVFYKQKWCISDTTKLQMESSIAPADLIIYESIHGQLIPAKTISWDSAFVANHYGVYELVFDVSDLPAGVYILFQKVALLGIDWQYISEPILLAANHPGTIAVDYKHKFNDYGVAWSTGIKMRFRLEMDILDFSPASERYEYFDQMQSVDTLSAVPFRIFKLILGNAPGVPPYCVDLMNRITLCSYTNFEGKLYSRALGSKWSANIVRGNRMMGAEIEMVERDNEYSVHFNDNGAPLSPGIITAYDIDTTVFAGGTVLPIIDVQIQE